MTRSMTILFALVSTAALAGDFEQVWEFQHREAEALLEESSQIDRDAPDAVQQFMRLSELGRQVKEHGFEASEEPGDAPEGFEPPVDGLDPNPDGWEPPVMERELSERQGSACERAFRHLNRANDELRAARRLVSDAQAAGGGGKATAWHIYQARLWTNDARMAAREAMLAEREGNPVGQRERADEAWEAAEGAIPWAVTAQLHAQVDLYRTEVWIDADISELSADAARDLDKARYWLDRCGEVPMD